MTDICTPKFRLGISCLWSQSSLELFSYYVPVEEACWDSDPATVPCPVVVCRSPPVARSLPAAVDGPLELCWFTTPDSFSIGFNRQLMVATKLGLAKSKLCGTLAKSFTSPFFSSSFMTLLGCAPAAAACCADWGPISIIVCTKVKIACSLECLGVDSGKLKARPREAFISATRACWASGAWWHVAIVASKIRAKDGVSSLSVGVPDGRRWSRMKARTGPSYCEANNKQSLG